MKTLAATFLLTLILVIIGIISFAQNTEQLYQKGLIKEEGEGNLQEAINIFNQIVEDRNAGEAVQAKALLHVGLCYEKLGLKEATKAYQRLVNNFPGQKIEVAHAKTRLAALGWVPGRTGRTGLVVRRLMPGSEVDATGAPSPDGRYLSITDPESGDLAILEIGTGQKHRLTNKGSWSSAEGVIMSRWSPDGKKIAYLWLNKNMSPELRIAGIDGTETRILSPGWILDWSLDGKYLLARVPGKNGTFDLALILVADGSLNTLKTAQSIFRAAFSPDGRYVVYELPQQNDSPPYDLSLLSIDGKSDIPLVKHPSNDRLLGWVPGTEFILFTSDRTGTKDAWAVRVTNGQPQGDPVLVKQDIGQASPMGFTAEGSLYYSVMSSIVEAYEVSLDLGKGAVTEPPKKIFERVVGRSYTPEWSPDGKYLAYVAERKTGSAEQNSHILCIRSEQTGEVREVPLNIQSSYFYVMHWSAGSDAVFAAMADKSNQGLFKIDIQTGKHTLVAKSGSESLIKNFAVSPDRKSVYYAYFQWTKKLVTIIKHDLETGQEKELYRKEAPPDISCTMISPDGKYLSFSTSDFPIDHVIRIMPAAGGETRDILKGKLESFGNYVWTPDGKTILFVKRTTGTKEEKGELWQVPSEGGELRKIDIKMNLNDLRFHPDGHRIAFTSGKITNEIWVMENFLPQEKLSQNKETGEVKESKEIAIRLLGSDLNNTSSISADGEYVAMADWDTGNLEIRNLKTGEKKLATNDATWIEPMQYIEYTLISPDGKLVAYQWYNSEGVIELRLTNVDMQIPSILYTCDKNEYVIPRLWFPDSKKLIAQKSNSKTKTMQLFSIDITNRDIQVLKENSGKYYKVNLSLSPDQKQLAFDFPNPSDQGLYDISLLSLDTRQELPLIKHPANDRLIGWLPGRNELLFTSDRSGATDIWSVRTPGKEEAEVPRRIMTNTGDLDPVGFTENGSLFYLLSKNNYESFIIPSEGNGTKVSMNSRTPLPGQVFDVTWLPDGKSILCFGSIPEKFKRRGLQSLFVINSISGEAKALATNLTTSGQLRISPDGKLVLIFGFDQQRSNEKDYKGGIYIVNIETGTPVEIKVKQDIAPYSGTIEWDKEGKNIFFAGNSQVIKYNIESGEEKIIYNARPFTFPNIMRSSDGNNLIIDIMVDKTGSDCQLFSINENGGDIKLLCTHRDVSNIRLRRMALSPDGKYIYFSSLPDDWKTGLKSILYRIPFTGGTPENLWQSKEYFIAGMSIHPEGNKMALSTLELGNDMRVIENLIFKVEKIYNQNE